MIWLIIFLIAVVIIIVTIIQNASLKKKYSNELDLASENLRICEARFSKVAKEIFESTFSQYGERFSNNIAEGKICENMPSELLILSWGEPGDKKSSYYKGNRSESWFYDRYINRLGNTKYKMEVFVENNKTTGWRDIN